MRKRKDRNTTMTFSFRKDSTIMGRIHCVIGLIRYHEKYKVMGVTGNERKVKVIFRKGNKNAKE